MAEGVILDVGVNEKVNLVLDYGMLEHDKKYPIGEYHGNEADKYEHYMRADRRTLVKCNALNAGRAT